MALARRDARRTGRRRPGTRRSAPSSTRSRVAIPGAAEPVTRKVFETVRGWGDGPATAIGMGAAPRRALGRAGQRHRRARARFRRQFRSRQGACQRRARPGHPRARRAGGRVGPRLPRRLYRRPADPRPGRPGGEPGAPQPRLARHRHGRRDRRRRRLRAAAEARRASRPLTRSRSRPAWRRAS